MNSSAISMISQQGVDISMLLDECDFMDPNFDEQDSAMAAPNYDDDDLLQNYLRSSSTINPLQLQGQMMPHNYSNLSTIHNNMGILNFGNHNPCDQQHAQQINPVIDQEIVVPRVLKAPRKCNESSEEARVSPTKKKRIRPPAQTYEHIMAERRRREQLSQLFVALSALIPGLKKMDKGSILEDAIKYTKELKERVKLLEEKSERKAMEPVVVVKKSQVVDEDVDDEVSSNVQSSRFEDNEQVSLPEVEVKMNENQILVKVLCEKQKDVLTKLITKVESLNMMVISANSTAFGNVALDITIVAQMENEFNLSVREVVSALREAIQAADA